MPSSIEILRLVAAVVGIVSIFLGYRLFCGLAGQRDVRRSARLTNLASGALLALFGVATLVAGVIGYTRPARPTLPQWQKQSVERGLIAPERNRNRLKAWQRIA